MENENTRQLSFSEALAIIRQREREREREKEKEEPPVVKSLQELLESARASVNTEEEPSQDTTSELDSLTEQSQDPNPSPIPAEEPSQNPTSEPDRKEWYARPSGWDEKRSIKERIINWIQDWFLIVVPCVFFVWIYIHVNSSDEKEQAIVSQDVVNTPQQEPAESEIYYSTDTSYQPLRESVIIRDTFHYLRTDTIKKRVVIIDTILGEAPPPKPDSVLTDPIP